MKERREGDGNIESCQVGCSDVRDYMTDRACNLPSKPMQTNGFWCRTLSIVTPIDVTNLLSKTLHKIEPTYN